jgi:hypothetical protein
MHAVRHAGRSGHLPPDTPRVRQIMAELVRTTMLIALAILAIIVGMPIVLEFAAAPIP